MVATKTRKARTVRNGATLNVAKAIFARGTDCFGPNEVMAIHGQPHNLKLPKVLPPIPWSEEELRQAHAAGSHLILIAPNLTMKQMVEARKNLATDGGKLLYQIDWYKDEPFCITATTGKEWDWRLVGNEVIPGSTSQNYLAQTNAIAGEIKRIFAGRDLPPAYQRAITELEKKRDTLAKLMDTDWPKAAKQLSELELNQLCRESPATTMYRLITYEAVNHERLLQRIYHWTPSLSSSGSLVFVGDFDRAGADLVRWDPRVSDGVMGVVLSRSALVESRG